MTLKGLLFNLHLQHFSQIHVSKQLYRRSIQHNDVTAIQNLHKSMCLGRGGDTLSPSSSSITINAHVLISTMWETIQPQKNWFNQETSVVALLPVLTLNCMLHSLRVFCSYTINTWPEKENHRRNAVICLQWSQDFQSFCSEFQWMGWSQVALKHDCNLFEITLIGHNDVGCL